MYLIYPGLSFDIITLYWNYIKARITGVSLLFRPTELANSLIYILMVEQGAHFNHLFHRKHETLNIYLLICYRPPLCRGVTPVWGQLKCEQCFLLFVYDACLCGCMCVGLCSEQQLGSRRPQWSSWCPPPPTNTPTLSLSAVRTGPTSLHPSPSDSFTEYSFFPLSFRPPKAEAIHFILQWPTNSCGVTQISSAEKVTHRQQLITCAQCRMFLLYSAALGSNTEIFKI